jgi:hypothetical protein
MVLPAILTSWISARTHHSAVGDWVARLARRNPFLLTRLRQGHPVLGA